MVDFLQQTYDFMLRFYRQKTPSQALYGKV